MLSGMAVCASAHITLADTEAAVGSYYKATFVVPHGCNGSPTVKIRLRIPDGVISVKPQPKAGWTLDLVEGSYAKPYALHGAKVASGVREVAWTGRLPDAYYDEFVVQIYLSTDLVAGSSLPFPVVQECERGASRWIDVDPKAESPAPRLNLMPAGAVTKH
jgi:uncharacterized protein YcnI